MSAPVSQPAPDLALSADEARRLAVSASLGLRPLPGSTAVLAHTGLLQLDPLAPVAKAHRLTCLARMPATATADEIDGGLWADGPASAFEAWVHAVCLVPAADWPLLRLAREHARASARRPPEAMLAEVRAIVADHPDGATISDIEQPGAATKGWDWPARKHATEHMLRSGELACTTRRRGKRIFDLPQRRIPAHLLQAHLPREEILAAMAARALLAMGAATTADVAAYYSLSPRLARDGLLAAGAHPVSIQGWDTPAWISPAIRDAPSLRHDPLLVGPFDNLIWDRARVRRIFAFDYVFEAYKPRAKRRYGYYTLALLDNCQLTGRADLTRDGTGLTVLAAYPEAAANAARFTTSLDSALSRLQQQLQPAITQEKRYPGGERQSLPQAGAPC